MCVDGAEAVHHTDELKVFMFSRIGDGRVQFAMLRQDYCTVKLYRKSEVCRSREVRLQ